MKYWLLTTEYPPQHGGGISTYCFFTARMLTQQGYAVTVFIPGEAEGYTASTEDGIEIIKFGIKQTNTDIPLDYSGKLSYSFAEIVKKIISAKGKPDIIEAQDYQGIAYYLLQRKHLLDEQLVDVPIVITLHSPAFLYFEYNRISTYKFPEFWTCEMEKQSIISADHLVSPTAFLKTILAGQLNNKMPPCEVIPNPFSMDPGDATTSTLQKGKVVYYGKLSLQKGSLALLEYCKDLWDEGRRFTLHVIGGTDIVHHIEMSTMGDIVRQKYSKYIKAGLLHLEGKTTPANARQVVQNANLVVFPSVIDNLPYAVIEMMSFGKVVLASVQGGQKEIITDGQDGFLFDHTVTGSFKSRLLDILSLPENEITAIGKNAITTIRHKYSYEQIFPLKDKLIRTLSEKKIEHTMFPFLYQEPHDEILLENDTSLLSIVIPYFNMGDLIMGAIDSIQKSSHKDIEIIVINDGSDDEQSLKALATLDKEPGIRIIHKKNEGLAAARNEGARQAKGDFLAFLDADDTVSPHYYQRAVRVLKASLNVYFVGSWVQYFENSKKVWPSFTPQPPYLFVHNPVNSSSLVYKTKSFLKAGLNDSNLEYGLEDYESVVSMMAHGYNGVVLPDVHFYYRVRDNSMFRKLNKNKLIDAYKYITEKHASYFSKHATGVINLLNANGPGYFFDNPTEEVNVVSKVKQKSRLYEFAGSYIRQRPALKRLALKILSIIK